MNSIEVPYVINDCNIKMETLRKYVSYFQKAVKIAHTKLFHLIQIYSKVDIIIQISWLEAKSFVERVSHLNHQDRTESDASKSPGL